MRYPQAVEDRVVSFPDSMELDPDTGIETGVKLRSSYVKIIGSQWVIEIKLKNDLFYIHIEDIQEVLEALKIPVDVDGNPTVSLGAEIGSWCIKTLDGKANYGMHPSEDPSGRHVTRLYQSQLDRLKALPARVFRDKTTGSVLDATRTAAIS